MTSWPRSAKQTPATNPTYPEPTTAMRMQTPRGESVGTAFLMPPVEKIRREPLRQTIQRRAGLSNSNIRPSAEKLSWMARHDFHEADRPFWHDGRFTVAYLP